MVVPCAVPFGRHGDRSCEARHGTAFFFAQAISRSSCRKARYDIRKTLKYLLLAAIGWLFLNASHICADLILAIEALQKWARLWLVHEPGPVFQGLPLHRVDWIA